MSRKSFYTILGITRDESAQGIRAAYLRLVKELHPDHAGGASTQAFREVQQAYDVLSDPEQKRRYDIEFEVRRVGKRPARSWSTDPLAERRPAEPLVPEPQRVPRRRSTPLAEDLFVLLERRTGGPVPFTSQPRPRSEVLDLEVTISAEQAVRGGTCAIAVPLRHACPACGGTGSGACPCPICCQRGWVVREHRLQVQVPAGSRSGTMLRLPPEVAGTGNLTLRLHLRLDRRARAPTGRPPSATGEPDESVNEHEEKGARK